ncbi:MAG: hypothetical protein DRN06_08840, partial [Thermoprotei archaeon]
MLICLKFRRWDPGRGWLDEYKHGWAMTEHGAKISIAKMAKSNFYFQDAPIWGLDDESERLRLVDGLLAWARERGYWPRPTRLPSLMPDGGSPGGKEPSAGQECYTCSTQKPLKLLRAHGLAGYLVIYDLPVGTPRWKLRRELTKLAEAGICFSPIQKSVLWCPTEGDAGAVAQAVASIADGGKIEVFAVARMSWRDLIKASEHKKRELLAHKLAELGLHITPEKLHALSIADVDRLLRLRGKKLARALEE